MSHEDYLTPDELEKERERFKTSPPRKTSETELSQEEVQNLLNVMTSGGRGPFVPPTPETSDLDTIESLIATKKQNENAIVGLVGSLQARLNLLNEAVSETKPSDCEHCCYKAIAEIAKKDFHSLHPKLFKRDVCICILVVCNLIAFVFGQYTNEWRHQKPEPPNIAVRPATEALEEFAARESQVLTADERRKLIAATETVLSEHFETAYAIREVFRYERLKAGVDSPAFKAFSEKWAEKVEEMQIADDTDAMRSVYESLLRGLKVQAYSDRDERWQTADGGWQQRDYGGGVAAEKPNVTATAKSAAVCNLPSAVSLSGEPVEGFLRDSPSIITPPSAGGDEPVAPEFIPDHLLPGKDSSPVQQKRLFRRITTNP